MTKYNICTLGKKTKKKGWVRTMFDPFVTLVRGWHVYARQSVVFAGVSLACLFTTVLAFDSVSVGTYYHFIKMAVIVSGTSSMMHQLT